VAEYLVARLRQKLRRGEAIVSLTAYDYFTALIARQAGVDFVLTGDSLGNVIQGAATTVPVTLEQMIYHTRIVCAHFPPGRVVLDMPFGTFKLSAAETARNCLRAFQESGCGGVKFEGATPDNLEAVRTLSAAGVPVLGHLGLLPQMVHAEGGYRIQGKTPEQAERLLDEARALEAAGAVGVVLECVVPEVAARITAELACPTIGIGSGPGCGGQIIVVHDILGLLPGEAPAFVKRYASLYDTAAQAVAQYAADVRAGRFPAALEAPEEAQAQPEIYGRSA
jgi:3-methyl-2-oxobutanoate hydroxymethyltransferase